MPTEDNPMVELNIPLVTKVEDGSIESCALSFASKLLTISICCPEMETVTPVSLFCKTSCQATSELPAETLVYSSVATKSASEIVYVIGPVLSTWRIKVSPS